MLMEKENCKAYSFLCKSNCITFSFVFPYQVFLSNIYIRLLAFITS